MKRELIHQITDALVELQRIYPQMRFGQLILTVAQHAVGPTVEATYEVSDEDFLKAIQDLILENQETAKGLSHPPAKRAG